MSKYIVHSQVKHRTNVPIEGDETGRERTKTVVTDNFHQQDQEGVDFILSQDDEYYTDMDVYEVVTIMGKFQLKFVDRD